jgi:hypothetical protein
MQISFTKKIKVNCQEGIEFAQSLEPVPPLALPQRYFPLFHPQNGGGRFFLSISTHLKPEEYFLICMPMLNYLLQKTNFCKGT